MKSLGLDVGGTFVKWVVLEDERVVTQGQRETQAEEGPDAVVASLIALGREAGAVDTVGVGIPGLYEPATGQVVFLPNVPGEWRGRPLAQELENELRVPTRLVNDARAFALAEWTLGAGRGCDTAVFAVAGTGVGGGIAVGGRLHEGREGRAGEIGHVTIDLDGPLCGCGNRGCLEACVREALDGDAVERAGRLLGVGIANAIVLLAPDRVVVGGGVAEAGDRVLDPLRDELSRRVHVSVPVEVVAAELGVVAGAIGAALAGRGGRG